MVESINIKETVEDAKYIFNNGFACSESVIYAIRKNFQLDLPDDVIAMSSGFPWGLGRVIMDLHVQNLLFMQFVKTFN